ncbi:uncharacterized protein EV154DRAFT_489159, partial [Mucor mucedo]|uniref:uncharacterized protein n=1 Tax=Mucor mucedo TaxID=29922 RepID=UPI00221F6F09
MACGIYAPNQIKSYIIYYVIKKNYPNNHPTMIMYCLEKFNINLHIQGQSTELPVEERPMATPRKRVVVEEASSSGSYKKQKNPSKNPNINDEAGCSDYNSDNNNDSGAHQVNDAVKTKKAPVDYHDNGISFGNWGTTIQYSGCFRFYCFGETLKKEYPGFHATFVELLKKCDYTQNKIAQMKVAGKRFNTLLYYFKH